MTRGVIAVLVGTAAAAAAATVWIPATDDCIRWWDPDTIKFVHPWRGDVWWNGPWGSFPGWQRIVPTVVIHPPVEGQEVAVAAVDPVATSTGMQLYDPGASTWRPAPARIHEAVSFRSIRIQPSRWDHRQVILPLLVLELLTILGSGLGLALWLHRRARRRDAADTRVIA